MFYKKMSKKAKKNFQTNYLLMIRIKKKKQKKKTKTNVTEHKLPS